MTHTPQEKGLKIKTFADLNEGYPLSVLYTSLTGTKAPKFNKKAKMQIQHVANVRDIIQAFEKDGAELSRGAFPRPGGAKQPAN